MKKLVITTAAALTALAAVCAWGSEIVLRENFEDENYKGRWDFTPENYWERIKEGTDHYMHFWGPAGGEAVSKKDITVNVGEKYKITYRYRGGPNSLWWGNRSVYYGPCEGRWQAVVVIVDTPKAERLKFKLVVGNFRDKGCDFDDVVIWRCETAVSSTSLGRVRALFR